MWLYIFTHIEQRDVFQVSELSRVCDISRKHVYELLSRGVLVFKANNIDLSIVRDYQTSPTFNVKFDSIQKVKKVKAEPIKESLEEVLPSDEIISYLNLVCKKKYRLDNQSAIKLIKGKLNNGFTIDDIKYVIDVKANHWLNSEQEMYLRPETLFGNKFETYLNEKPRQATNKFTGTIKNAQSVVESDWGVLPKQE